MVEISKPIIIIASPRVGSNLLMHSLAEHPDAVCGGEWHCVDEISCRQDHWRNKHFRKCNLIKIMFQEEIPFPGLLVGLFREDIESQLASWKKACDTGIWMTGQTVQPSPFPCLQDAREKIICTNKRLYECCDLVYSYESLVNHWDHIVKIILTEANWPIVRINKAISKQL